MEAKIVGDMLPAVVCKLAKGESVITENGGMSWMEFRKKLGAGFFGGEGFIMQKITGPGKVYLEIDGSVIKRELAEGEKLKVDNGYVAAMTQDVKLDIETVKGVKNVLFGGEGLFVTTLKGPGTVYLQTMPVSKLASLLYLGQQK